MSKTFHRPFKVTMQAALAACCLFVALPAQAQQDDMFNRISRLEREIDTLNRAVYRGDKAPAPTQGGAVAAGDSSYNSSIEVRLSDMEKQIRDLTGRIEQQGFEVQQMKDRVDRAQADMELRLNELEKKSGIITGSNQPLTNPSQLGPESTIASGPTLTEPSIQPQAGNPTAPIDPNAPAPSNSPTQQNLGTITEAPGGAWIPPNPNTDPASLYENAFSQLKSGNYGIAQRDFDGFLRSYPDHPLAQNATYWLGETYYAQGRYDQASRVFAESYKKYPKGPKAADSLLKLGMSLGGSGKSKEACVSLKQLKKEFSTGGGTAVRRAEQEMSRLGCTI